MIFDETRPPAVDKALLLTCCGFVAETAICDLAMRALSAGVAGDGDFCKTADATWAVARFCAGIGPDGFPTQAPDVDEGRDGAAGGAVGSADGAGLDSGASSDAASASASLAASCAAGAETSEATSVGSGAADAGALPTIVRVTAIAAAIATGPRDRVVGQKIFLVPIKTLHSQENSIRFLLSPHHK